MFTKKENNSDKYLKLKISKNFVIGESENAVLFMVPVGNNEYGKFWINKNGIFYSNYSNILTLSLINDTMFDYGIYKENNNDWTKPDGQLTATELIKELTKIGEIAILNKK